MSFEELANFFHDFLQGHEEEQTTTKNVVDPFMATKTRRITKTIEFVIEVKSVVAPSTVTELGSVAESPDSEVECVTDDACYSDGSLFIPEYMEAWLRDNELPSDWMTVKPSDGIDDDFDNWDDLDGRDNPYEEEMRSLIDAEDPVLDSSSTTLESMLAPLIVRLEAATDDAGSYRDEFRSDWMPMKLQRYNTDWDDIFIAPLLLVPL